MLPMSGRPCEGGGGCKVPRVVEGMVTCAFLVSDVPRFLDHVKNEDSPGPPIGSHHAFFSDDQEPCPVTDIADLIRDSYEVPGPRSRPAPLGS